MIPLINLIKMKGESINLNELKARNVSFNKKIYYGNYILGCCIVSFYLSLMHLFLSLIEVFDGLIVNGKIIII